jgi:hypothetical protein
MNELGIDISSQESKTLDRISTNPSDRGGEASISPEDDTWRQHLCQRRGLHNAWVARHNSCADSAVFVAASVGYSALSSA